MEPISLSGRTHRITPEGIATPVHLYREDEAGFAVAGGKRRKYAALVPWLQSQGYQQVAVIGSLHSNNVLAAAQFLGEAGFPVHLFLKSAHFEGPGNAFLTELLVPRERWRVLAAEEWPGVADVAAKWAAKETLKTFVLPEGAVCEAAFWGTTGLANDLAAQEAVTGMQWERIFVDAGTGLSAAGLIWAAAERNWEIEVVGMALGENEFAEMIARCGQWYGQLGIFPGYRFHTPHNARSFGAVNQTVRRDIVAFARRFGVLTDPIYSAKLFRESFRILRDSPSAGPALIVHSGGGNTLAGFYDQLRPHL